VRGEIFTSGKEFSGLDGGRFIGNGDGTISDPVTGIMWQRDAGSEALLNWKDALAYCESLELGGHSDWRLPDVRSLGSIVDYSRFEPAIGAGFQCWWDTGYWTSTTLKDTPQHAWVVGFWYGDYFWAIKESGQHHVRCARGGPLVSMENAAGPVE
jgi:hypothetical protein